MVDCNHNFKRKKSQQITQKLMKSNKKRKLNIYCSNKKKSVDPCQQK